MSTLSLVLYGCLAVVGTVAFSNSLVSLFRWLKWDRAARVSAGLLPFVVHALHIGADVITADKADRVKVGLSGLSSWAEENDAPAVVVKVAQITAELRPKGAPVPPIVVLPLLMLWGCAGSTIPRDITTITDAVADLDPALHSAYETSQRVCLVAPADKQGKCVDDVRAAWAPLIDLLEKIREVECKIAPNAEGCAT